MSKGNKLTKEKSGLMVCPSVREYRTLIMLTKKSS